jgi:hypothetical protein
MSELQRKSLGPDKASVPEQHVDSVLVATKTLLAALPPDEQQRVLAELRKLFRPAGTPLRSGASDVLAQIVRLLPEKRTWTVEQIKQRVEASGVSAEPKAIYNALTYLKRRNDIVHHGYGRYSVDGNYFVTSEEAGGVPTPHEQHDVET